MLTMCLYLLHIRPATNIKLNDVTQTTFTYDLSGNQITKYTAADSVTFHYAYDSANWLESVTRQVGARPATEVSEYSYDANGQRRQKAVGSSETNYYYSGINLLYTENSEGGIIEEYLIEPDGSIIRAALLSYWPDFEEYSLEDGFYYRYDIRGSVTNIVYNDDSLIKSYTYDAYGNTQSADKHEQVVIPNSIAYTGAVIDEETDLYYMNARYYDPETGRFISQDTYRGSGEEFWHAYLYCNSDPVNHTDPTGHWLLNVAFLSYDLADFIQKPTWGKALWIGLDLLCFLDPTGAASTLSHAAKLTKFVKAAKKLKNIKLPSKISKVGMAFSTGWAGEKYLSKLVGGKSQQYFKTSNYGGRYIDQLAKGIAHESKVGYTTLTYFVKRQILKDWELIQKGKIKGAEWHFFRSAITGKIGASLELRRFLYNHGIDYKIHY